MSSDNNEIPPPLPLAEGGQGQGQVSTLQGSGDAHISVQRLAILDHRLSHGAFRLFNYLRDRQNKNGQCWETQRQIAKDMRCKPESLSEWTKILVKCGYIAVDRIGQNHNFRYTMLPGDGNVVLPQWASRAAQSRAARKGGTKDNLAPPQKDGVPPKQGTPRAPQTGGLSNSQEVTTQLRGEASPKFFPRELDKAIDDQRAAIRRDPDNDALWEKLYDLETLKFGSAVTTRKPTQQKTAVEVSPSQAARTIGECSQEERERFSKLLRQSVENQQP